MNIIELEKYLSNELINNTFETREKVLNYLTKERIISVINSILNDESIISKIANQSYTHDNGFDKIMLIDNRPNFALRLHLWNPKNSIDGNIHNHEWDLTGKVLLGSYTWEVFEKSNDIKNTFYHYECIYNKKYNKHELINEKKISMRKFFNLTMTKDSSYTFDGSMYHKINMTNDYSATLMIHSRTQVRQIEVISKEQLDSNVSNEYRFYTEFELEDLLKNFIQLIGNKYEN